MSVVFWFRRDRRLGDNEALSAAFEAAGSAGPDSRLALMSPIDESELRQLSGIRQHSLLASLEALNEDLDGRLNLISGPAEVAVSALARELGATAVFATEAFDPDGMAEQQRVAVALSGHGSTLNLVGSYYLQAPGSVQKPDGGPYRVYTPFYRAWSALPAPAPFPTPNLNRELYLSEQSLGLPRPSAEAPFRVRAGEAFALKTLDRFLKKRANDYHEQRNRADLPGTSHLSHALAHGEIHPRTIVARLGNSQGHEVFEKEIAWREFYADVLWHNPHTVTDYYEPRFARMRYETGPAAEEAFRAWTRGETGYPMVDAGMRQLLATGWMHNRVRMIVASFLVKDLHLEWQLGARWFEQHLSDYDPASNSHGWQWTAGCGTDASPYFRVFNPVLQGLKFDPEGDYVRKYIPELRHIPGAAVHEPWKVLGGLDEGYPAPMVDHFAERDEALRRLAEIQQ